MAPELILSDPTVMMGKPVDVKVVVARSEVMLPEPPTAVATKGRG
jgi:hypothetical protein